MRVKEASWWLACCSQPDYLVVVLQQVLSRPRSLSCMTPHPPDTIPKPAREPEKVDKLYVFGLTFGWGF